MLKKILVICIVATIILSMITTIKIAPEKRIIKDNNLEKEIIKDNKLKKNLIRISKKEKSSQNQIGKLKIEKINLNESLFKVSSQENTIEKHVTILKESILPPAKDSIIFLAAHSGTGKIAYFEELDNLKKDDKIILNLNNETYTYFVKDIWEEKKNGYINVKKESVNQLILTTCSPKRENYQLIVNCISKS